MANDVYSILDDTSIFNYESVLRERGNKLAIENGFTGKDEIDAFRHTYASAVLANRWGPKTARFVGNEFEVLGYYARNPANLLQGKPAKSAEVRFIEAYKDIYNNERGIGIGSQTRNEQQIVSKVSDMVHNKEVLVTNEDVVSVLNKEKYPGENIRPTAVKHNNTIGGTIGGFFSKIAHGIGDFFGSIFSSPAAAAEPPAAKSDTEWKRVNDIDPTTVWKNTVAARSQQNKVTTPPFTPPMNGGGAAEWGTGSAGANMMNNMFDSLASNIAGQAVSMLMGKLLGGGTHTSSKESARSTDALASFKLSRGQMQAQLLEQMTRGKRNV